MEKEHTLTQMELFIQELGWTIHRLVKDFKYGQMEANIKDNSKMEQDMDSENIFYQMGQYTLESGEMGN